MATTRQLSRRTPQRTGKGAARALRRQGRIPAVIYGHDREPEALDGRRDRARHGCSRPFGSAATLVDVTIDERAPVKALIREIQRNPVRPVDMIHLDLYEISANEKITVEVPVHLIGIPDGVRNSGGVLDHLHPQARDPGLPQGPPRSHRRRRHRRSPSVTVVFVRDVKVPNAEILNDPGQPVCTVVPPRAERSWRRVGRGRGRRRNPSSSGSPSPRTRKGEAEE